MNKCASTLRYRAFTLVEVLIVIAIVLVLVAILLPVFNRAKLSAHETATVENLRQYGQALNLYRMEWGGYPPGDRPAAYSSLGFPHNLDAAIFLPGTGYVDQPCRPGCVESNEPVMPGAKPKCVWTLYYGNFLNELLSHYGESVVVKYGMCYTDDDFPYGNFDYVHKGIGVRADGSIATIRKSGNFTLQSWWQNDATN